ncbi:reverse transcriptase domain-containing protein [Tanacetum coccineum]
MADNRTMAQMLQAPIEGYEDAIVVPPINANNFELKQPLINLVQSNKFTGRQDPHNHLRFFNKVTSTFRHPEVPNTSVKLLLFPFSLDGEARDWLDKEPPRSILTWDDLVSKFINQYFPPSKTTYYRNEIITFYQKPNEAFNEAWERFKGLLRQCRHLIQRVLETRKAVLQREQAMVYARVLAAGFETGHLEDLNDRFGSPRLRPTDCPSKGQYKPSAGNASVPAPVPESAPAAPQSYQYDSNYQPAPEKIAEAHKAARFAVGALAFDDVFVAVDYLKKSLELLTNPSASV